MMRAVARPYAIGGLVAALVGAVGAITLRIVDPVPLVPDALGFSVLALVGFEFLGLAFASVGALLVIRRPENAVGWVMVLIGASNALAGLTGLVTSSAVADGPAGTTMAGLAGWLTNLFVMLGGLVIALGFIFPTGRGHTPAWDRFVRFGAIALLLMLIFLVLIRPGPLQVFATIENPFGFGPDIRGLLGSQVSTIAIFVFPILVLSVVSRYRMSDRVGRQQLKWFILAFLVTIGGFAAAGIGALLSNEPPEAGLVVFGFAGALVPVAIGIAILRHGLYDIDRLISRTVGYAVITAVLAGVFGVAVLSLGLVLGSFAEGQTIAVAGSTLLVAALFGPLRRRAQAIVDRRFDRGSFDAAMTLQAMTARLRDDVDLDRVEADVLGVVDRTFHPTTAGHVAPGDPMRVRRAVALACLTLAIGGAVGAIVIQIVSKAPFLPAAFGFGPAALVGFIVMGLSWASIGAFLRDAPPGERRGPVVGDLRRRLCADDVLCGAGVQRSPAQGTDRGDRLAEYAGWATLLANQVGAFGFLILFIFPTGRAQSPGWAWFTRIAGLMMLLVSVIVLTQPGPLHHHHEPEQSVQRRARSPRRRTVLAAGHAVHAHRSPGDPAHARDAISDGRTDRAAATEVVRTCRDRLDCRRRLRGLGRDAEWRCARGVRSGGLLLRRRCRGDRHRDRDPASQPLRHRPDRQPDDRVCAGQRDRRRRIRRGSDPAVNGARIASPRVRPSRWPLRHSPPSPSSSRSSVGFGGAWTCVSTALGTTPIRPLPNSRRGCATRWISRPWPGTWTRPSRVP